MNEKALKAELYKVKREIRIHGTVYDIYRDRKDSYVETVGESEKVCTVNGLFHTSKGYISRTVSDGTDIHSKGQPQMLLSYEDSLNIENGDYILVNEQKFKVVEKSNIQEYNIVVDISMELILDGRN